MDKQLELTKQQKDEDKILIAKVLDKLKFAENRNRIETTDFLDLREQAIVKEMLELRKSNNYKFLGGYEDAERNIVVFSNNLEFIKQEEINNFLAQSNHAVIREKQKQRNDYEKRLVQAKSRLNSSVSKKLAFIRDYGNAVFAHDLTLNAMDFIDESELKGTVPAPYNKQLIQDILEQQHCICGAHVVAGSEAFIAIMSMLLSAV